MKVRFDDNSTRLVPLREIIKAKREFLKEMNKPDIRDKYYSLKKEIAELNNQINELEMKIREKPDDYQSRADMYVEKKALSDANTSLAELNSQLSEIKGLAFCSVTTNRLFWEDKDSIDEIEKEIIELEKLNREIEQKLSPLSDLEKIPLRRFDSYYINIRHQIEQQLSSQPKTEEGSIEAKFFAEIKSICSNQQLSIEEQSEIINDKINFVAERGSKTHIILLFVRAVKALFSKENTYSFSDNLNETPLKQKFTTMKKAINAERNALKLAQLKGGDPAPEPSSNEVKIP